jgi:uncharacterized protein YyaL (SSP411 family)
MSEPKYTNRLIHSTSPYLLQHAHNPVDWYPWGEEALARARAEDKPILVSIGYSACHWCHVMEHESFENETTAALMNSSFICIKVDREERPDIDSIYMTAVQAMTGSGGWPLNAFLLPDGTPFYGGTYFPSDEKASRYRMPTWNQVLDSIAMAFANQRADLERAGAELLSHVRRVSELVGEAGSLQRGILDNAILGIQHAFDGENGGFGGAPKFPQPMILEFLLRSYQRSQDSLTRDILTLTLDRMAQGGMYDQLGGGFHRYSVDDIWLVPHFEKMLYDNAQLARLYAEAYLVTANPYYRRISQETLDYVVREMRHPEGGFFSAQDADSEGEEGKFFVWTLPEIRAVLGGDSLMFSQIYGVTAGGNFEGKTILNLQHPVSEVARVMGMGADQMEAIIDQARAKLFAVREQRVKPGLDDKVLTAWNGMMLRAFVVASQAFGRPDYLELARQNADFLLRSLRREDGRVLRTWKDGRANTILGYLEDYAHLVDGLLALYSATGESRWLRESMSLTDAALLLFWDDEAQIFYDTANDAENLVVRPRDISDNATPSGNSTFVSVLLRLANLTGRDLYRERAELVLTSLAGSLAQFPMGFGRMLTALDDMLHASQEVVIVGDPDQADTQALWAVFNQRYRPYALAVPLGPNEQSAQALTPLLEGRSMLDGKATAYVCQNFACQLPVTSPEDLKRQLGDSA